MGFLSTKKSEETPSAPSTPAGLSVIAVGMSVHGSLNSNGTVRIEGTVEGDVTTAAQALIAKGGVVRGDVSAEEVIVGGSVTGAVRSQARIEIQSGGVVEGDLTTRRILVAEGATLNGRVRMGEEAIGEGPSSSAADGPAGFGSGRTSVPVARVAVPPRQPLP